MAPAPPADSAPPRQVSGTSPIDGSPATYIVVIVVNRRRDWTFGLVSVTRSRASVRALRTGTAAGAAACTPASIRCPAPPAGPPTRPADQRRAEPRGGCPS